MDESTQAKGKGHNSEVDTASGKAFEDPPEECCQMMTRMIGGGDHQEDKAHLGNHTRVEITNTPECIYLCKQV